MMLGVSGAGVAPTHARSVLFAGLALAFVVITILAARLDIGEATAADALILLGMIRAGVGLFSPTLDYGLTDLPMESLIAFVGCDGSGKSTLTHDLGSSLSVSMPVEICYLGLGTGALGERIKRLPLIGAAIERLLAGKATQARTKGEKIPGLPTALVIYLFSFARLRRFKRMLRLRRDGFVVLTDRYPQIEFAGTYDGPGLSAARAGSSIVAALARQELRIYSWMAAFKPTVVVRLNIDVASAAMRKPDHRTDLLVTKVAITQQLRFGGAAMVDLDATRPYGDVRMSASEIVERAISGAGAHDQRGSHFKYVAQGAVA